MYQQWYICAIWYNSYMSIDSAAHAATLGSLADIDRVLAAGMQSLDISELEYQLAVRRYREAGLSLDRHWQGVRGEHTVLPQGSFPLGTVTRRADGELDLDSVVVRDCEKESITQQDLKSDVGKALEDYRDCHEAPRPKLEESDRCWTLTWSGMHMDVLPTIPDPDSHGQGLLITDKAVRMWQQSDPVGFIAWFHERLAEEQAHERAMLAKSLNIADVPAWRVKTTLQRAVQILKRHRDVYFTDRPDDRPSSIVITALAALAYPGSGPLFEVVTQIANGLPEFVRGAHGRWEILNPVQMAENFADTWNTEARRADGFFEWADVVKADLSSLTRRSGLHNSFAEMSRSFGDNVAMAAKSALTDTGYSARKAGSLAVAGAGTLVVSTAATSAHAAATSPRRVGGHDFYGGTSI